MKLCIVSAVLLLSGCGLKTGLVVYDDSAPLPELASLSYQYTEEHLILQLAIQGGGGAVLYQMDRGIVDPDCSCILDWMRFYESTPSQQRSGLKRQVKLRSNANYAYRFRAVDSLGRQSGWSKAIREDSLQEGLL